MRPTRELQQRVSWTIPVALVLTLVGVTLFYSIVESQDDTEKFLNYALPLAAMGAMLAILPSVKRLSTYYLALLICTGMCLIAVYVGRRITVVQLIPVVVLLIQIALSEPYPLNLIEGSIVTILAFMVRSVPALGAVAIAQSAHQHVLFLLPCMLVVTMGSHFVKHRERSVDLTANNKKLTESVVALAKANTAYQDYAVDAREQAEGAERHRIARDIHDIVGYTLTNNMMLMETALHLAEENPLAVPSILLMARENAEEGLEQVRTAMYKLKAREIAAPSGLRAVSRLVQVFGQATDIKIQCDFGNAPVVMSDEIDSAVYHLVQEGLVNSFRHGNATQVNVAFWYGGTSLQVSLYDNGKGSDHLREGVGLGGMRERVEALGGTLEFDNTEEGFAIAAWIPTEGQHE